MFFGVIANICPGNQPLLDIEYSKVMIRGRSGNFLELTLNFSFPGFLGFGIHAMVGVTIILEVQSLGNSLNQP